MDLFKRIQDLSAIYDDDGPSATVLESRPMFNDGGMLVQPSDDGSRPGYRGERVYNSPDVDTFSDALLDAYAKDDITKIVESGKSTKFANVITAIESGKNKSAKLAKVIKNTGLDEETIFNLLDDRKAYIDLAREGGPAGANPRAGNFYRKAENWITTNSKRYADPDKFKKAFIRTFGTNNDLIKTMKKLNVPGARKQTSVPFSSWFKETILGSTKGSDAGYNFNQLNNIFKTSIYTNNETVRNKLTKEINRILSIPLEKGGKFDIRNEIKSSPLFKKFGFDKQIRGPIARLLANEIGQELLDQVSSFRDPYLGTTELIRFLKNNVDPKYKSMFEEAAKAADLAAKNKWPEAKQILKIKDNIMFDHKIPKELVKLGYADELEYIKLNPTSAEFNTRIKNPEFDQKIIKLAKDFERTTSLDGKAKVVEKMNILKNNFSKKYGGYLDEVSIVPDKTGKPIFKSSAAPVTKQTDFVSSLGKSMVQAGEISKKDQVKLFKKMGYRCNKSGGGAEDVACYLDDAKQTRADLKSSDINVRAKAITKQRNALNVAKKLPEIGKVLRRVGQGTLAGVTGTLKALGFTSPIGYAIEGAVEGGIYDYYRKKGYNHEQSLAETFTPGIVTGRPEGVPWYGGAEKLLEKELIGDPQQNTKVLQYLDALKDQEQFYDAFGRKAKYQNLQNTDQGTYKKLASDASADIQDLYRSGTVSNINRIMNPESMASQAYNTALETQAGRQDQRARDYKAENYAQTEPSEFMQEQKLKDRNKAMLEMFPSPTVEDVQNVYKNAGREDILKLFKAQDYKNFMKNIDDYQKQSYFADNFREEKAGGGIAKEAGDRSGAMTRSMNPDSQGLSYLFNRVKKV